MKNMDCGGIWDSAEDDLFYEELRRQVLLLTAEDDDEKCEESKQSNAAKSLQQRFRANPVSAMKPGCYYHWSGGYEAAMDSVPRWLFNLWHPGGGTGVFIPQIVKSRRRYKPRKKNNEKGRTYKPVANVA